MHARLLNLWENTRSSLWFVPSLLVAAAVLLSALLITIDRHLIAAGSDLPRLLFGGTAGAAQTILATIAGSLITVISIAFSLTVIALQQAAGQFSPRVLRHFTADRRNQFVLGMYTATFIYALLVLRVVRSEEANLSQRFIPALSVTVAIALALVCLGLLVFFIHHMAQELQLSVIMDRVRRDTVAEIAELFPPTPEAGNDAPEDTAIDERFPHATPPCYVRAHDAGFIRAIDHQALLQADYGDVRAIWLRRRVGEFVPCGGVLAELDRHSPHAPRIARIIRAAIVLDSERTINQDPLFGVRLLADAAVKALSPAVNDPTTAEYALLHLGDILCRLAQRAFPPTTYRTHDRTCLVVFSHPSWDEYVDLAFAQIRRLAINEPRVTATLLHVIHEVGLHCVSRPRREALRRQLNEIRAGLERSTLSADERAALERQAEAVAHALRTEQAAAIVMHALTAAPPDGA